MTSPADHAPPVEASAPDVSGWLALHAGGVVAHGAGAPRLQARASGAAYAGRGIRGELVGVTDSGTVEVSFEFPDGPRDIVRLRLPALPGRYRLDAVAVDERGLDDLEARVLAPVPPDGTRASVLLLDDFAAAPAVEIDLRDVEGLRAARRLVAWIRRDVEDPAGAAAIAAVARLSADLRLAEQGSAHRAAAQVRRLEALVGDLAALRAQVGTLEAGIDGLRTSAGSADAAAIAFDGRLVALAAHLDAGLADAAARTSAVAGALPSLEATLSARLDAMAGAEPAWARALADRQAALAGEVAAVRAGIENVFWRRWLRALRGSGR